MLLTLNNPIAKLRLQAERTRLGIKPKAMPRGHGDDLRGRVKVVQKVLRERFPIAFAADPVPLKAGIVDDIVAATNLNQGAVSAFLFEWCRRGEYLQAIVDGVARVDLLGTSLEVPTDQQRAYAASVLRKRMKTPST